MQFPTIKGVEAPASARVIMNTMTLDTVHAVASNRGHWLARLLAILNKALESSADGARGF